MLKWVVEMMILFDCVNTKAAPIFRIAAKLVHILQFLIPIILIVLVALDLFKAMSNVNIDDKTKKDAMNKILKRLIYAVIIFLIPMVVNFLLDKVMKVTNESNNWFSCWTYYYNNTK